MSASIWNPAGESIIIDPLLRTQLISALGGNYVNVKLDGLLTVMRSLASKIAEIGISPADFGATGTSIYPGDTVAVQKALDDPRPMKLDKSYYIDSVKIRTNGKAIDFNGYELIGCTNHASDYCVALVAREVTIFDMKVNANFKSYTSPFKWYSESVEAPAQYNKIFGCRISNGINGFTFGEVIGSPAISSAQSENVIFGLSFRAIQNCFTGNQPNGFITLINPVLDCNPYEWTSAFPGVFNQEAARCFNNPLCNLVVVGGEVLKTSTQLGYGFEGRGFSLQDTKIEIACKWGLLSGDASIKNGGGFMSSDSVPCFVASADSGNSKLTLDNFSVQRGAGVGVNSAAFFMDGTLNASYNVSLTDCKIEEWRINSFVSGCTFNLKNTYFGYYNDFFSTDVPNILQGLSPFGDEIPADGSPCYSWTVNNVFGTGTPSIKSVNTTSMRGASTAIQFTASAGSTDFNSRFFRVPGGKFLLMSFLSLRISGGANLRWNVSFYDAARTLIGATSTTLLSSSLVTPALFNSVFTIPANAKWVRLEPNQEVNGVAWYTGLTARIIGVNYQPSENIYGDAAPTAGVWMKGDRVQVINPVAAGYSGYICTAAGSPGTWKGYGLIQA